MKKENLIGIIVNVLFFVLISIANYNYMALDVSAYITKSIASILFVLCGVFNLIYSLCLKKNAYVKFMIIMVIGLVFACLGDILLIEYFIIGAVSFAIGHVFYFVAFSTLHKLNLRDFIFGGTVFALGLILLLVYPFEFKGMLPLVIVYALIISMMLGKAISNIFSKNNNKILSIVIAVGAFLFFFSDMMLVFDIWGNGSIIFDYLCLGTYYPAEFILALSLFLISFVFNKQEKGSVSV